MMIVPFFDWVYVKDAAKVSSDEASFIWKTQGGRTTGKRKRKNRGSGRGA